MPLICKTHEFSISTSYKKKMEIKEINPFKITLPIENICMIKTKQFENHLHEGQQNISAKIISKEWYTTDKQLTNFQSKNKFELRSKNYWPPKRFTYSAAMNVACWNIKTFLETKVNNRPRRKIAITFNELSRYVLDITDSSKIRRSTHRNLHMKSLIVKNIHEFPQWKSISCICAYFYKINVLLLSSVLMFPPGTYWSQNTFCFYLKWPIRNFFNWAAEYTDCISAEE